jgi:hypothetical protein
MKEKGVSRRMSQCSSFQHKIEKGQRNGTPLRSGCPACLCCCCWLAHRPRFIGLSMREVNEAERWEARARMHHPCPPSKIAKSWKESRELGSRSSYNGGRNEGISTRSEPMKALLLPEADLCQTGRGTKRVQGSRAGMLTRQVQALLQVVL